MIAELVFATGNAHKLSEAQGILGGEIRLLTPADAGLGDLDLTETHDTLEGNATEKAALLYHSCHCNCFAEDTGLEVEALHGAPGVYSARYAGPDADAGANIAKLLGALQGKSPRTARFRTIIALWWNDQLYQFEGQVRGRIANAVLGEGGFGYDPVFIPDHYDQTFAELSSGIKNKMSHRAEALRKMRDFLKVNQAS